MLQILYHSCSIYPPDTPRLFSHIANLVAQSLHYNERHEITGVLAYGDGRFIQVVEGPDDEVESLFAKIEKDPRHRDVWLILRENVPSRVFDGWSMAYVERNPLLTGLIMSLKDEKYLRRSYGLSIVKSLSQMVY